MKVFFLLHCVTYLCVVDANILYICIYLFGYYKLKILASVFSPINKPLVIFFLLVSLLFIPFVLPFDFYLKFGLDVLSVICRLSGTEALKTKLLNLSRFCFIVQVSNEEAKKIEISKLQKMLEALNLELDAAKLANINECNKNAVLQNQLELSVKEKSALKRDLVAVDELRKENALLKVLH